MDANRADNRFIALSIPIPELLKPAPPRKRLWQGAIALLVIVLTFTIGNRFVSSDRAVTRDMLGHDFLAFYTAGTLAREGKFDQLYNLDAVHNRERAIAATSGISVGSSFGPYWNPPFYAWVFAPLSALSFQSALIVWVMLNLAALATAIVLLVRMLPDPRDWKTWTLVPLLICISMPFIQAVTHAQNTFVSLLLLSLVVTAWRARHDVTAGLLCGLLFYKPQLGAIVAVVLVMTRGMRVCIGLSFVLGSLLLFTAYSMPGAIGDYLTQLPVNVHFIQNENTYLWERHVTFKSLFRLFFQGRTAGNTSLIVQVLTIGCSLLAAVGLAIGGAKHPRRRTIAGPERPARAATIA